MANVSYTQWGQVKNTKLILKHFKKLLNVCNYYMYLNSKFHVKQKNDEKVVNKKHPSKGKGTKNRTTVSCNHPYAFLGI